MNENQVRGAATKADGRIESLIGEAIGDDGMQASGKVREFVGSVQKTAGDVSHIVGKVTRNARRTVTTTDQIVTDHPYAVLAACALFGVVAGILLTATRTRVIYVRPRA